jgi:hypothetical protein
MALERGLHHAALDAVPAPVDDADLAKSGAFGGGHVFLHDRNDIAGYERVEVQFGLDRYDGHVRRVRMISHVGIRR